MTRSTAAPHYPRAVDTKDAERAYPETIGDDGRAWLHSKPFRHDPAETSRLLVDAALVIALLSFARTRVSASSAAARAG